MKMYRNLAGNSGVTAYELGTDSIIVCFKEGSAYLYNYASTGVTDIETMKYLAQVGQGLNTFISRVVRGRYARKLR